MFFLLKTLNGHYFQIKCFGFKHSFLIQGFFKWFLFHDVHLYCTHCTLYSVHTSTVHTSNFIYETFPVLCMSLIWYDKRVYTLLKYGSPSHVSPCLPSYFRSLTCTLYNICNVFFLWRRIVALKVVLSRGTFLSKGNFIQGDIFQRDL